MGVAGLVFEPPPPNFEKMHNFPRYTNDIIMKYGYFHWFKSLKKSLGVSFTDILVLLGLLNISGFSCLNRGSFQPRFRMSTETNFGFIWPKWHLFTKEDKL